MSSDKNKTSGSSSSSGSSPGSTSTTSTLSSSTTPTTPNPKNSNKNSNKKRKISVEATSSNETIDDSPGFKKIKPLRISTEPVKEYKKFSATQLARNWQKEQKERKG